MQEVTIDIKRGVPKVSVKGAPGKTCKAITAELEADLGEVVSRQDTAEARMPELQRTEERKLKQ